MTKTVSAGRPWLPSLALVLTLAHAAPAFAAQGRLIGTVVDPDGKPIAGVQATLVSESGGTHLTTETDKKGRFHFLLVDPTHPPYVVRLTKEGYQPFQQVVKLESDEPTFWKAELRPGAAPEPAAAPPAPAAGENPKALELYNQGAVLYNDGKIPEAVAKFEAAIAEDSGLAPAYRILATLYAKQGRHQDALAAAERLLELAPGDADAKLVRYDALVGLGRAEEAEAALGELVKTGDPKEVAARVYNVAVATQKRGEEDRALERFHQAVDLDPALAPAWSAIAGMELARKRPEQALEAASKLLALRPGDDEALTVQYEAYEMLGETDKAAELEAQIDAGSKDPETLYRRGVALFNASKYPRAVAVLQRAVEADPKLAGAHYTLGLALINQGDRAGALEHLQRFVALAPDSPDAASAREMIKYLKANQ